MVFYYKLQRILYLSGLCCLMQDSKEKTAPKAS